MDILSHAIYGATVCSRHGFAGGRRGYLNEGRRWYTDSTIWWAAFFGVWPDIVSMGPSFVAFFFSDMPGNYFSEVNETTLVLYRYIHSMVIALPCCTLVGCLRKSLFFPSLAWPLHIVVDATTHGTGKFQTIPFYPLFDWRIEGINWWEHPTIFFGYWAALPIIWLSLWMWRRTGKRRKNFA